MNEHVQDSTRQYKIRSRVPSLESPMLYLLSHRALQWLNNDLTESTKALCGLKSVRCKVSLLHYRPGRHLLRDMSPSADYQQARRKVGPQFQEEKQLVGRGRSTTGRRFYQPEQSSRVRCNLLCQFHQLPRIHRYRVKLWRSASVRRPHSAVAG